MEHSATIYSRQLDTLEASCSNLTDELAAATLLLRDEGQLIPKHLISELNELSEQILRLDAELRGHLVQLAPDEVPPAGEPSLKGARDLLRRIALAKAGVERTQAVALSVLDFALTIAHIDTPNYEPLVVCQRAARELREALLGVTLPDLHPEVLPLARGQHPLAALMTLMSSPGGLDDSSYGELLDLVEGAFGRSMTIALVRNRLRLANRAATPGPAVPAEAPAMPEAHLPPVETLELVPWREAATLEPEVSPETPHDTGQVLAANAPEPLVALTPETPAEPTAEFLAEEQEGAVAPGSLGLGARPLDTRDEPAPIVEQARLVVATVWEPDPAPYAGGGRDEESALAAEVRSEHDLVLDIEETYVIEEVALSGAVSGKLPEPQELPAPVYTDAEERAGPTDARQSRQQARLHQERDEATRAGAFPDLLITLLCERQTAQAYHLARAYQHLRPDDLASVPPWLVRALVLAPHVGVANSATADELALCFAEYDPDTIALSPEPWPTVLSLLLMATLPAALIAPETGLPSLLQTLPEEGMPPFCRQFCDTITIFGLEAQPLNPRVIRLLEDQSVWEQELTALRAEATEYWAEYEHKELLYDPATDVWQNWTSPRRFIHRMVTPIIGDTVQLLDDALDAVNHLRMPLAVKREVDHTDRQVIGRNYGPGIGQRALEHLRLYTQEAIALVRRWEQLDQTRPSEQQRERIDRVRELRTQVFALHDPVVAELAALNTVTNSATLRCAAGWSSDAVERVIGLLERQEATALSPTAPYMLLNWPLLWAPDLALDEQWHPGEVAQAFTEIILKIIAGFDGTWQGVLDACHTSADYEASGRIIAYLEAVEPHSQRLAALRQRREQQLAYLRSCLLDKLDTVRRLADSVIAYGLLREDEVQQAGATLMMLQTRIEQHEALHDVREQLQQLGAQFAERRDAQIRRVRETLNRSSIPQDSPKRARIEQILDSAYDPLAATEYISLAEQNDDLPQSAVWGQTFRQFIGPAFRKLVEALQGENLINIAQKLKSARANGVAYQLGPINFHGGPQMLDAQSMLEAWGEAKRLMSRPAPAGGWDMAQLGPAVQKAFDQLGFLTSKIELLQRPSRRLWMTVSTAPLTEKEQCPIPRYGSEARGCYRLLVVHDRAPEDELIQEIADIQKGLPPIIIFYFGQMTSQRRRSLARLCREKLRTCLLLDDTLTVFLSQYRARRLSRFFECTLPFTYLDPYVTTAGIVPLEMFYGRQREQDEILNPMGSCFIYGGRQIGKTALLRHIVDVAHNPRGGQIICVIDLKDKGIGFDRPIEAIWAVIGAELQPYGVLPANLTTNTGFERYKEHIENWLHENSQRQIIMLLDEADQFLDSDGSSTNFLHTSRLKGLMDSTRRRFKVIFAGLHNVQRTTRQSNNPLAHYGTALCIGPLFENNEWREARALIERPIASLGYRFETPDLVTRILSQTNYYPSLLQLYGGEMIRYLSDPNRPLFAAVQNPPYTITQRHIEDIYQRRELRNNIRRRFRLTLELDRRYEVLTYVVADNALQDEQVLLNGLSVAEIRAQALDWWAAGFERDPSEGMILSLLEELVGLGVFRRTSGNRFTLRNANMLLFLGTQEEIRGELRREREVPPSYNAAVFRSAYVSDNQLHATNAVSRSPLTVQQIAELQQSGHGTSIVFGTSAAGLHELTPYLRQAFGQSLVIVLPDDTTEESFQQQIQALSQRSLAGVTLLIVPLAVRWTMAWVERAQQRLARLTSRTAFARAIFIADPQQTWDLLTSDAEGLERALSGETRPIVLQPWQDAALHQWFIDCDISPREPEVRARVTNATGNWPALLYAYHQRVHKNLSDWEGVLGTMVAEQERLPTAERLASEFGLTIGEPQQVLGVLAELFDGTPVPSSDIVALLEGELAEGSIHRSLHWASLLNLIMPAGHYRWLMPPVLQRVLRCLKRGRP